MAAEPDASPIAQRLRACNASLARRYPGERIERQPVHTVYGGAHLFRSDSAGKLGEIALRAVAEYMPDPDTLAETCGIHDPTLAARVYERVLDKLRREPVEDFRLDYEDGYGTRADAEEDGHAASGAREVAKGLREGTLPPFIGLRIKPLSDELQARSFRTLRLFLRTLLDDAGRLPSGFVVTLPKILAPEHVTLFAEELTELESSLGLDRGALRLEVMIETPQIVLDRGGRSPLPLLIDAAGGRLRAAHFGTYDYTAGVNITAAHQRMHHPACVFARDMMQVAFAGTGVWLSDGSTTVMPVPIHRAAEGATLTAAQQRENGRSVRDAWRMHFDDVTASLRHGFYQGWDLHPAQLVTRYGALYAFFLAGLDEQAARLRAFVQKAAQATLVGDVFDDAATGQGLLNSFLRAVNCGAITEEEAARMTGLQLDELRGRSFVKILASRRAPTPAP